jgi:DNA polymerase elongation subunit (family B)
MSPKEMFRRFARGDPDELGEVAEYCIKDTVLPHRLMDKLCNLLNLLEMAKATWVPINYLAERGQQIKVFSQMTRKARELGYKVPTIRHGQNQVPEEGYTGATVLEAQTGAYYTPITALDFEGLYPSIMIAHNLCYSTLVLDPKYDNVPGVTYEQFGPHRFAQNVSSLLPEVLKELKEFRKKAKKDMAGATGAMKQVYNGKQLAYKVSMNSVYGFTGAGKGMLPCVAIASTVTMRGRGMIDETKNYVEANFPGAKVRYGDSVTGDTALLLRVNGRVTVKRIDELQGSSWSSSDSKEFSELNGVETWTEQGWTRVHRVIKHQTDKRVFRVTTRTGSVCVTEDHSLLDPNGVMVQPKSLRPGNKLLHSFPTVNSVHIQTFENTSDQVKSLKTYLALRIMGFEPSVSCDSSGVYTVALDGCIDDPTTIQRIEEIAYTGPVFDLTTGNHHFHAGVGQLIVHNTDSVMVEFDVQGRTGQDAIEYSWHLGEQAAEQCTALFKKPNNLELEKVYCPYFLYSKKRYAAKLWTRNKSGKMNMDYIDVKGLQLVRRDNTPFVREVCKELLDVILESNNPEGAKQVAHARAAELLDGRVPMEKLVLSQRLGDSYKSDNLPHVQVVKKMREREPGSEPQSGDRVPFVLIKGPSGAKQFEKAEDPAWVASHNLALDYKYYFSNKFMNPVCDLLEPLVPNPADELFGKLLGKKKNHSITDLFTKFETKQKMRQIENGAN